MIDISVHQIALNILRHPVHQTNQLQLCLCHDWRSFSELARLETRFMPRQQQQPAYVSTAHPKHGFRRHFQGWHQDSNGACAYIRYGREGERDGAASRLGPVYRRLHGLRRN